MMTSEPTKPTNHKLVRSLRRHESSEGGVEVFKNNQRNVTTYWSSSAYAEITVKNTRNIYI